MLKFRRLTRRISLDYIPSCLPHTVWYDKLLYNMHWIRTESFAGFLWMWSTHQKTWQQWKHPTKEKALRGKREEVFTYNWRKVDTGSVQGWCKVGTGLVQGWHKVAPSLAQGKHRIVQVRKEFISQQYVADSNFKLASSLGQACCLSTCFKEVLFLVLWPQ